MYVTTDMYLFFLVSSQVIGLSHSGYKINEQKYISISLINESKTQSVILWWSFQALLEPKCASRLISQGHNL